MKNFFKVNNKFIGDKYPTYFIADIADSHDGSFERAKKLIELAKENGANAAKFQHHDVRHYINDYGFKNLGQKLSHQKNWKKTIFEVYHSIYHDTPSRAIGVEHEVILTGRLIKQAFYSANPIK